MANAQTSLDITNSERKKPVPPKQVPNAYQLYQHQNKERVVQENREADEATIMRLLATDWAFLSDKEKRPYIEKIEEGKKRYALAYKAYEKDLKKWKKENDADESEEEEENGSDDASNISKGKKQIQSKKQRKKKVVDPNAPKKKTANPYLLFAKDNRAKIKEENPKWKNTGILKEIGRLWSSMSELEKAPYVAKARTEKENYIKELEAYQRDKKRKREEGEEEEEEQESEEKEEQEERPNKRHKRKTNNITEAIEPTKKKPHRTTRKPIESHVVDDGNDSTNPTTQEKTTAIAKVSTDKANSNINTNKDKPSATKNAPEPDKSKVAPKEIEIEQPVDNGIDQVGEVEEEEDALDFLSML